MNEMCGSYKLPIIVDGWTIIDRTWSLLDEITQSVPLCLDVVCIGLNLSHTVCLAEQNGV